MGSNFISTAESYFLLVLLFSFPNLTWPQNFPLLNIRYLKILRQQKFCLTNITHSMMVRIMTIANSKDYIEKKVSYKYFDKYIKLLHQKSIYS